MEQATLAYKKAQLAHQRYDVKASQQRAGGMFTAGSGESQLEVDRRSLEEREKKIRLELESIEKRRRNQRMSQRGHPRIAVVGYTNVGKSCLVNKLTGSNLVSKDQLFCSLDTHSRLVRLPKTNKEVLLVDCVGFISELPHQLVASFRATLESALDADLVVHVRDMHHPEREQQQKDVISVLKSLNLASQESIDDCVVCWNKLDLVEDKESLMRDYSAQPNKRNIVLMSAAKEEGLDEFLEKIESKILPSFHYNRLALHLKMVDPLYGKKMSFIRNFGSIEMENLEEETTNLTVLFDDKSLVHFLNNFPEESLSAQVL